MTHTIPFNRNRQLYLSLDVPITFELSPECYSVLLLLQELDYSKFEQNFSSLGRPHAANPRQMMELILYAKLIGFNSCRSFRHLKTDLCALWIMDNKPLPSFSTFSRFITSHEQEIEDLFYQVSIKLYELGEIKGETIHQDGTKIESAANKYTFVWRKVVEKNMPKCFKHLERIYSEFITVVSDWNGGHPPLTQGNALGTMIEMRRYLRENIVGIDDAQYGRGIKASKEVKIFRMIEKHLGSWMQYIAYSDTFSAHNPTNRNSFSKTDVDATFMHIKEDHMRNAQLKPAYNIQNLVDSNYVVATYCSADRTDYRTCVPAMETLRKKVPIPYKNYCADAGYDIKENYEYLQKNGIESYIKPLSYSSDKKRKNKHDPSRRSNMKYLHNLDAYECTQGKYLVRRKDLEIRDREYSKTQGYKVRPNQRIYQGFTGCIECPVREGCMKSTAKRGDFKRLKVDTQLDIYRLNTLTNIESDKGKMIRVNRSIQAEGSFALIKNGLSIRRFKRRGYTAVKTEWILHCMTANTLRFMHRLAQELIGTPFEYFFDPALEKIPKAI